MKRPGVTQNSTGADSARTIPLHSKLGVEARRAPTRWGASIINFFVASAVVIILLAEEARAEVDKYWTTLNCDGNSSSMLDLNRTVLCFDGPIEPNLDLSVFRGLKSSDYVVMRSAGGDPRTAMRLSDILREKNVPVILYDYCLGACADYLLIANRTFVRRNTIIAWRGGQDSLLGKASNPWCHSAGPRLEPRKQFDHNGAPLKEPVVDSWCEWDMLTRTFFKERELDDRYIHAPQTPHTKKKVRSALMKEADKNNVYWMWNPKNYGNHFKSRVSFDSYPRHQDEVDSIIARHRLGVRVVFDP